MAPIVFTVLQGLFLLLLYVFVARAVRWVIRDVNTTAPTAAHGPAPAPPPARPPTRTAVRAPESRAVRPRRKRPATPPPPTELVVHFPSGAPRVLDLEAGTVTFGRHEGSTVVLSDPYVSDHHARVYRDRDEWILADQGSTNGTFLNQVKITTPTPLQAGDQVGIGKTVVEVRR